MNELMMMMLFTDIVADAAQCGVICTAGRLFILQTTKATIVFKIRHL